jgi:enoyl-CoA hydratase
VSDEPILETVMGAVATVWLNRPAARNALSAEIITSLPRRLRALDDRDDVAVIVLTGTDPAFSAGVDLKEFQRVAAAGEQFPSLRGGRDCPVPELDTPIIAAVNGAAITGGFELALACDFIVASDRAVFADTHAHVGLMPGWGMSVRLAERVGVARAKELTITSRRVDAEEALRIGIANHVVPHDDLLGFVGQLAEQIIGKDPRAVTKLLDLYDTADAAMRDGAWELEHEISVAWEAAGVDPKL